MVPFERLSWPGFLPNITAHLSLLGGGQIQFLTRLKTPSGDGVSILGKFTAGGFSFQRLNLPDIYTGVLSLETILKNFLPNFDISSLPLPPAITNIAKGVCRNFQIDTHLKLARIALDLGKVNLLHGIFPKTNFGTCNSTSIHVNISYSAASNSSSGLLANCFGHILGFPGSASLRYTSGRFSFTAKLPKVTLSSVMEHVNAGKSSFSTQLKSFGLLSSSLSNVSFNILTNPLSLRASGHLQLGSLLSATCELLVIHPFQQTNRSFALGIESSDIDLSSLVKLFFKVDISGIPLFDKLHIPSLRLLLIPKEINFASVHFHTSSLQAFAQELLPHSSALLARIPIQLPKVGDITLPVTLNKQEMSFQVRSCRHMTIHLR